MPRTTPLRASLAGITRHRPNDVDAITAAKRELKAAVAENYIRRLVDDAPPLSPAQRARLAVLLQPEAAA